MFSSTAKSSRVEQLRVELAEKKLEARQLDHRYRQVALCAEPVTTARSTVELTEVVVAEPDRQRRRFNAAFVRSLIDRDRPADVHAVIQNRLYLLDEDVHQGRNPQAYARWRGNRTEVLAVLDELAKGGTSAE